MVKTIKDAKLKKHEKISLVVTLTEIGLNPENWERIDDTKITFLQMTNVKKRYRFVYLKDTSQLYVDKLNVETGKLEDRIKMDDEFITYLNKIMMELNYANEAIYDIVYKINNYML